MPSLKLTASKFAPENRPKLPQQERQTSSSRIIFLGENSLLNFGGV